VLAALSLAGSVLMPVGFPPAASHYETTRLGAS
jgi:hypothetical protein